MHRRGYLFFILAHLAIVLPLAFYLNVWADEGSTLHTTEHGFFQALQTALADEKQAPLYFWTLSWWREINHSIFFARLFSVLCSAAAIKVFADLTRRLFGGTTAILMTAFFALHPYLIWASLEIRVYSAVVLLSVGLLKLAHEGYFETDGRDRKRKQIYFILLSVVALYTNYYSGFTLAGIFFALLITKNRRAAKRYFLQMLIVGAAVAPLLWAIKSQFAANTSEFQPEKSVVEGLQILWNFALTFVLPTEITPPETSTTISIVRLWLVRLALAAGIVWLVKKRRAPRERELIFGTVTATIFVFLLAAYFSLGANYVEIRHAAVLFAPLILFGGAILRGFSDAESRANNTKSLISSNKLKIAAGLTAAAFFAYSIAALYPHRAKRGDWARVGEYIERNELPQQPLIVFTAFDALTVPYHYHGANRVLPDEKFFEWGLEGEIGAADSWRRQTEFIVSEIPADANEIWLLTNDKCLVGQSCEPLENFVRANYTIIQEKDFYKEKVRLLRRK